MKKIIFLTLLILNCSCRLPTNFGFYQPITLDTRSPDGPPEYKAGWRDGCRSGMGQGAFLNSTVYQTKAGPTFSPVYTHDSNYQAGWGQAFWACMGHELNFTAVSPTMQAYPLQ